MARSRACLAREKTLAEEEGATLFAAERRQGPEAEAEDDDDNDVPSFDETNHERESVFRGGGNNWSNR